MRISPRGKATDLAAKVGMRLKVRKNRVKDELAVVKIWNVLLIKGSANSGKLVG
jgi:hypothetical protein